MLIRQDSPSLSDRLFRVVQDWREVAVLSGKLSRLDGDQARTLLEREGWIASAERSAGVQILWRLMRTLGLNVGRLRETSPKSLARLETTCAGCSNRSRCELALADGSAASSYREFCPNGAAIDAMLAPQLARRA